MQAPSIRQLGRNFTETYDPYGNTLYFSYNTLVAFRQRDGNLVVSENVWSVTTGKHLNQLDGGDKAGRVPRDRFIELYRLASQDV